MADIYVSCGHRLHVDLIERNHRWVKLSESTGETIPHYMILCNECIKTEPNIITEKEALDIMKNAKT